MADTNSWGWYAGAIWPGYNPASQDNLGASGNGLAVDPAGYVDIVLHDADGDGVLYDQDTDDVAPANPAEYVAGGGLTLYPQEIALYTNSTMVAGGVTYTGLDIEVTLFTDGTWGARLLDTSIPSGVHHSTVTSITLGTWNGVEYDGVYVSNVDAPFICFAAGTNILTPEGERPVESLREGDFVLTLDHGPKPLVCALARCVVGQGRGAPVEIARGQLGNHSPLRLSQQHRVLLRHPALMDQVGGPEALVAVKHLLDGIGYRLRQCNFVTYHHLLCEGHEVIFANGAPVETLLPGPEALKLIGAGIIPIAQHDQPAVMARPCLSRRQAMALLSCAPPFYPAA